TVLAQMLQPPINIVIRDASPHDEFLARLYCIADEVLQPSLQESFIQIARVFARANGDDVDAMDRRLLYERRARTASQKAKDSRRLRGLILVKGTEEGGR
ncbi:MAG: hypothetical protein ABI186_11125, partial [Candidatus Elarobacter sp.]